MQAINIYDGHLYHGLACGEQRALVCILHPKRTSHTLSLVLHETCLNSWSMSQDAMPAVQDTEAGSGQVSATGLIR